MSLNLGVPAEHSRRNRFVLLLVAIPLIALSRLYVRSLAFDWLNIVPALATLYVIYILIAPRRALGAINFLRTRPEGRSVARRSRAFVWFRWCRVVLAVLLVIVAVEFGLRCRSYHRSLLYERQGDLLFAPIPTQEYVEKISLSRSHINNYGLRGGPISPADLQGKQVILCLGDSITYGYGIDDVHTYPAALQEALNHKYPGRFLVLNGGVNAYPLSFMDQRFLHLWKLGLRPQLVIIGYSMNEGWLGHLVDSNEQTKHRFEQRVHLKNQLRSFAIYNLIIENWSRSYYDRLKGKLVPGTNSLTLSKEDQDVRYGHYLQRIVSDLTSRNVQPVLLLFCSYNGQTQRYDTDGPLQKQFSQFAQTHSIPLLRSEDVFRSGEPANNDLGHYFIDSVHMNDIGAAKVAQAVAEFLVNGTTEMPSNSNAASAREMMKSVRP